MNILLIGAPSSGKGTQAEKLIERFNLGYIEMGKLLRKISQEETPLGSKVKKFLDEGKLVSDEIVIEVVKNYLKGIGRLGGILFDGFPRIIPQAEYLENFLSQNGKRLDLVIYLVVPREEIFKRISNRRMCEKCGKTFNLITKPSQKGEVCDYCGGRLIIRSDETPEKVNVRLDQFENQTKPLIERYREKGLLEEVDGNRPIEPIAEDIFSRIAKRGLA